MTKTNQQKGEGMKIKPLEKSYNKELTQLEPLLVMYTEYIAHLSKTAPMFYWEAEQAATFSGFMNWLESLKDTNI